MPNTVRNKKNSTENLNTTETSKTENINNLSEDKSMKELEDAKNEIKSLKDELSQLMNLFQEMNNSQKKQEETVKEMTYQEDIDNKIYEEPSANKNIKIISLYYGSLNLSDGHATTLSFDKYGQVKNCLYGKLVDIVNKNSKFAEEGYFYIADKGAVYHLGLSDIYKNIKPKEVLDNICIYDDSSIKSICDTITDTQKEEMAYGLAYRKFNGESLDYNKLTLISKLINKDILAMIKDMEESSKKAGK